MAITAPDFLHVRMYEKECKANASYCVKLKFNPKPN